MLVVADSSPLNVLVRIGHVEILPRLFGVVCIPAEVQGELTDPRAPTEVREFLRSLPNWLQIHSLQTIERIPPLGPGEQAAISLAVQLKAAALLIDERDGRKAAAARGLTIIGTLGVLEQAAGVGLIDLPTAIERLRATDFRLDHALIDAALRRVRGEG